MRIAQSAILPCSAVHYASAMLIDMATPTQTVAAAHALTAKLLRLPLKCEPKTRHRHLASFWSWNVYLFVVHGGVVAVVGNANCAKSAQAFAFAFYNSMTRRGTQLHVVVAAAVAFAIVCKITYTPCIGQAPVPAVLISIDTGRHETVYGKCSSNLYIFIIYLSVLQLSEVAKQRRNMKNKTKIYQQFSNSNCTTMQSLVA